MIGPIAYIAVCVLLIIVALVMTFKSKRYAVAVAYAVLCIAGLIAPAELSMTPLIFWGVALVAVLVIDMLLPADIAKSNQGLGYIAGGGAVGMFIGLLIPAVVLCTATGGILGGIAYAKTPEGKPLEFPSSKFLSYLCAKGFPAVIAICIIGVSISWLLPDFMAE